MIAKDVENAKKKKHTQTIDVVRRMMKDGEQ